VRNLPQSKEMAKNFTEFWEWMNTNVFSAQRDVRTGFVKLLPRPKRQ
jgi:hypothetical protein